MQIPAKCFSIPVTSLLVLFGHISIVPIALASITVSHHDIALFSEEEGTGCAICHERFSALAQSTEFLLADEADTGLGPVGEFCFACHDGSVGASARIVAPDGSIGLTALMGGHGFLLSNITEVTGGLEDTWSLEASGLLGSSTVQGDKMDCTACHDPHAAENPPFLRAPIDQLCIKCHSGTDGVGGGRYTLVEDAGDGNWAHPVGMPVADSGMDNERGSGLEMSFNGPDGLYNVPAYSAEELRSPTVHWEMGGHLVNDSMQVSCVTCHSAHLPTESLLVANISVESEKVLCTGCHTDGMDLLNPGLTPFFHPAGADSEPPYRTSSTPGFDLLISIPDSFPVDTDKRLLCTTCHTLHNGLNNEKCLRVPPDEDMHFCDSCHLPDDDVIRPNRHHLTKMMDFTSESPYAFESPSWWDGEQGSPGDLSDGLTCVDCHTALGISAHNW